MNAQKVEVSLPREQTAWPKQDRNTYARKGWAEQGHVDSRAREEGHVRNCFMFDLQSLVAVRCSLPESTVCKILGGRW